MRYPEHIIEQVREQSDIVDILSDYTTLTQKGHSHVGLCPFHNEKTPSFSVSRDKGMYYCFGCGAGGNVISFIMEKENMTFPEALMYLAERAHIELKGEEGIGYSSEQEQQKTTLLEMYKKAARYYYHQLFQEENKHSMAYFVHRSITTDLIKKFGLGYAPADYRGLYKYLKQEGYADDIIVQSGLCLKSEKKEVIYDRFSDRVVFPIFDTNKRVVAFGGRILNDGHPKYLNSPESMLFDKSRTLYGLHLAKQVKHSYYILVEGYMDVIAMHKAGFSQTVASLGTAFTQGHARLLKRYTNQVVILYDSDLAGQKATLRAIDILRQEKITPKVLQLKDAKDPDEFLERYGIEKMQALLEGADSDIWFKITQLEKNYELQLPEQKVQYLQEVAKLIANLESSIEQSIYMKEVVKTYQIDGDAFEAEVKKYVRHQMALPKNTHQKPQVTTRLDLKNTQLVFLSAVYHYPYVYAHIREYIEPTLFDEGLMQDLATHIFRHIENNEPIDLGYLNQKYPDSKEQQVLSTVLMHQDKRYEDEETLKRMLTDTIKSLNMEAIDYQLKHLKDIKDAQKLIEKKKVLDKLYIDFING